MGWYQIGDREGSNEIRTCIGISAKRIVGSNCIPAPSTEREPKLRDSSCARREVGSVDERRDVHSVGGSDAVVDDTKQAADLAKGMIEQHFSGNSPSVFGSGKDVGKGRVPSSDGKISGAQNRFERKVGDTLRRRIRRRVRDVTRNSDGLSFNWKGQTG